MVFEGFRASKQWYHVYCMSLLFIFLCIVLCLSVSQQLYPRDYKVTASIGGRSWHAGSHQVKLSPPTARKLNLIFQGNQVQFLWNRYPPLEFIDYVQLILSDMWVLFLNFPSGCAGPPEVVVVGSSLQLIFQFVPPKKTY